MSRRAHARRAERGVSMIEILVAMAILVIAGTIALILYDASRKSFKTGENLTEQQQAVRIAFDRLNADLRMAGFNYNPDGDRNRPDEQLEAAYDTAVVVRADYDAEDPAAALTPEQDLDGTFLTVSTGNDEVVAYVLAKPDGSSTGVLRFVADVDDEPRDGDTVLVSIPNVATVQNDPPYTLYRITLNPDASTYGTSNFIVRTPLVENVRSLTFRYFSQTGVQVNSTYDLTTITDDIGGLDTAATIAQRAGIRRIGIAIEGMTRDPDPLWVDATDTDPDTRRYRKFDLAADVTPRNFGLVGVRDLSMDLVPPSQPDAPTLVAGHCGGLLLSWSPNPVEDQVTSYRVSYGTSSGSYSSQRTTTATSLYLSGLSNGVTYYVMIQASDAGGNLSVPSSEVSLLTANTTTPDSPEGLVATSDLKAAVRTSWTAVSRNEEDVAGDPLSPRIRDLAGYRVYRGPTNGFAAGVSTRIADETVVRTPSYTDNSAVNCRNYYYRVAAVDTCGVESAPTDAVAGDSLSTTRPKAPTNVQAFIAGFLRNRVVWNKVDADVEESPITIDRYRIWRTVGAEGVDPTTLSYTVVATVSNALEYVDTSLPSIPSGFRVYYRVSAVDDCPNESELSDPAEPTCAFSGTVGFVTPTNDQAVAGVVTVQVAVTGGSDTYTHLRIEAFHEANGTTTVVTDRDVTGSSWTNSWLANPPGPYTLTATVSNAGGCTRAASIHVAAGYDVGCCLSPPTPDMDPVVLDCTGPGGLAKECREVTYLMINNNCMTAVAIESMTVTWDHTIPGVTRPKLMGVRFDASSIWAVTPPSASPATNTFTAPKPSIAVSRNTSNPVQVTYAFDQVTAKRVSGTYYRDAMTTSYSFRLLDASGLETAITGTCGPSTGMFDNLLVEQHN